MGDVEAALALQADESGWAATIPSGWAQGRTTFGGLVAAYLARAAQAAKPLSVRSIDTYFLEPVVAGPISLEVDSTRAGKYLTHLEVSLHQAGRRAATGRFILGDAGPGRFDSTPPLGAPEKAFDDCLEMPFIDGMTPEFSRNLQVRIGEGELPFSGSPRAVAGGFVRNRGPARGVAALLTHADAFPPPVLALMDRPAAASTVRWHVQFHADVDAADGTQWSWIRNDALWRHGPLSTVVGTLARDGVPVAYCEQTVTMYA